MRPKDYRLCAGFVSRMLVTHLVACLQLQAYKQSVSAALLARLLLLVAATGRSLSAITQRCAAAPCDEAVRLALHYNLPVEAVVLLDRLLDLLEAFLPPRLHQRPVGAALDLHLRPYYGDPDTPGTTGGKHTAGTDRFWAYGTLVVLVRGLRLTVGLCPVDRCQSLVAVVQTLLTQARRQGVRLAWLLLDRGFYDAQVVRYLQRQQVPFVLPMIRRGDRERGTGTQRFFRAGVPQGWSTYTWTARPRQRDPETGAKHKQPALTVRVRVCVVRPPGKDKPWVFVAWGLRWDPALVARRYRRRFGIETSYRQLGQCLAQTTSRDSQVRLLYVGLALVLRQYWAWSHYQLLAEVGASGQRRLRPERLQLADVLLWILVHLVRTLRFRLEVETVNPLPHDP